MEVKTIKPDKPSKSKQKRNANTRRVTQYSADLPPTARRAGRAGRGVGRAGSTADRQHASRHAVADDFNLDNLVDDFDEHTPDAAAGRSCDAGGAQAAAAAAAQQDAGAHGTGTLSC